MGRHRSAHGEVNMRREVGKASSCAHLTLPITKATAPVYRNFTFIGLLRMPHPVGGVVDVLQRVTCHVFDINT